MSPEFDCALFREQVEARLLTLERTAASHETRLALHDSSLARLERTLDSLTESNKRIEVVLERILDYVREPRKERTHVYGKGG